MKGHGLERISSLIAVAALPFTSIRLISGTRHVVQAELEEVKEENQRKVSALNLVCEWLNRPAVVVSNLIDPLLSGKLNVQVLIGSAERLRTGNYGLNEL